MSLSTPPNETVPLTTSQTNAPDANDLAARVTALETRFSNTSWLYGPSFLKRAFAMWGHVIVIQFVIGMVISVVMFGCMILFSILFGGMLATLAPR